MAAAGAVVWSLAPTVPPDYQSRREERRVADRWPQELRGRRAFGSDLEGRDGEKQRKVIESQSAEMDPAAGPAVATISIN
jgi:hypothetical protein